jgi:hypothetical protein
MQIALSVKRSSLAAKSHARLDALAAAVQPISAAKAPPQNITVDNIATIAALYVEKTGFFVDWRIPILPEKAGMHT